jgi:hypothetical protein
MENDLLPMAFWIPLLSVLMVAPPLLSAWLDPGYSSDVPTMLAYLTAALWVAGINCVVVWWVMAIDL